ncbi:MAG: L,D-transpeptidase family protein [gamma proteobacterium symbiont of Bathyaustriella thionipta]|nr:L,D-transpeptidase family protein [gamma proteobacterium symbiont of Bathyaustriella thionipta]MCU7958156.1 L,D-transpeptidase family protein [gamma proteobacterium symbiont of Bathyaustriella thionipta]MCU7967580.1 L,D-transpeptidase family protein [gamma proteobacterium symbiont of Bathyaustriella thionipta]
MLIKVKYFLLPVVLFIIQTPVWASVFNLPADSNESLIGLAPENPFYTHAKDEDTLLDVARLHNIGQNEIVLVNPDVDRWMPGSKAAILIPNSRVLPNTPRTGLTLNLPEYRLYYFPPDKQTVITHPVSIGRQDWNTPLGQTKIVTKKANPTWTPPESIKKEHAEKGEILPDVVPAGPDNPLGLFALRLGLPGYLIHGTNKPYGVGMRVSHGCVRMYPEDIERLFPEVRVGMPVNIVNQPVKVGWWNKKIVIEVHPQLEGEELPYEELYEKTMELIKKTFFKRNYQQELVVEAQALRNALEQKNGLPVVITQPMSEKVDPLEELF